jgi:multidrug efflux system outer membrane protein
MLRRPPSLVSSFLLLALTALARPPSARGDAYRLDQLLELARESNPGLIAGAFQTAKVEGQLSEANRSWMPSGELLSVLAPAPDIQCQEWPVLSMTGERIDPEQYCIHTNVSDVNTASTSTFRGVFSRTELKLVQPLFTFGKISAGKKAAQRGLAASKDREAGLRADVDLNVKRAYYGLKLARSVLETLQEGLGYLDDAQKQVEKELAEGTGGVTQTDRLRLRTVRAELDIRMLEAQKGAEEAMGGLRALLGPGAPADLDIDSEPLEEVNVPERPALHYEEQARLHRPEVSALDNLALSKRSLADLERRKQYPDLVILGTASYAYTSSIDNPRNAFLSDPFNTGGPSGALALALRLPLDLGVRNARAAQVKAEADEANERRREALGGIAFEVRRAHASLTEASKRLTIVRGGERASKAWVTAVGANFGTGLAEAKDFSDALVASFQFRVRVLQTVHDLNIAAAQLTRATGKEVTLAPKASEATEPEPAPEPAEPEPADSAKPESAKPAAVKAGGTKPAPARPASDPKK